MSLGTLYTTPQQTIGKIIKAAAALGNFTLDAPEGYVHFETNKTEAFLSKFPHGKIPAFESKDGGFKLFEGYAIARYVASQASDANLLGQTPEDAALVDQWSHLVDSELVAPSTLIGQLCRGTIAYSKPVHTALLERIHRTLGTFNKHLTANTFLVGERLTLADLVLAGLIQKGVEIIIDAEARAKYPAIIRHLETIVNQPKLKGVFGETNYTEKGIVFTPPPKEKKEAAPKPAAAPKAEKKPKAKDDDDNDDEPAAPAEPK
ncbi:elongation factor 1-gamma [Moniliophthora roreri MCA 2997]|uniref:Elongation factor 1-gamma n=1 Tax=Moniliophthora roreri (strain MCA 2997) TaxID=1381753 RepID=V2X057_MONRO|nr:elongation factor 1-gamma [Moniliophthora roreri MCA 2997]